MKSLFLLLSTFVTFTGLDGQAPPFRRIKCYSCSTVNATQIIGGAGVDPGVFLSTIRLGLVPVTARCADPFQSSMAVRAGGVTPICDDGLCVKINYTDKFSGAQTQRCFSCTTLDADSLLREVNDERWREWLMNVRYVPKTTRCGDTFEGDDAVRAGAAAQACDQGLCMKMWFREKNEEAHVWRSCIPNAVGHIREDCTKIVSSEGEMQVCTCQGDKCNGSTQTSANNILAAVFSVLFFLLRRL